MKSASGPDSRMFPAVLRSILWLCVQFTSSYQTSANECQGALGMENGAISDGQVSASSQWNAIHAAWQGRLNFQEDSRRAGSWSARKNDVNQWLQVNLGQYTKITRVATQGRNGHYSQWVTKYKLQYSNDGVHFHYYREHGQSTIKEFVANTDKDTVVYHNLSNAIQARYVRFRPTAWHNHISVRVEVYGCKECQGAFGMENGAISDGQISASSQWNSIHAAWQGRLNFQEGSGRAGSWSARENDTNQWLQIDLGNQYTKTTRVATQGRNGRSQWVTKYKLQYSNDGVHFHYYREGHSAIKEFVANTDKDTVVYHDLSNAIQARYVRFRPTAWHNHISMRVEVYGCKAPVVHSQHATPSIGLERSASSSQIAASALVFRPSIVHTTSYIAGSITNTPHKGTPGNHSNHGTSSTVANRISTLVIVVITVSTVSAVAIAATAAGFCTRRKRRKTRQNSSGEFSMEDQKKDAWEMKKTDIIISEQLGQGAFGKVFKGIIRASPGMESSEWCEKASKKRNLTTTVAVKMLEETSTPDQMNDFLDEINLMKAVGSHNNIVSLIGCCTQSSPIFLVVEFASKGDLLSYLRERRKQIKSNAAYMQLRESTPHKSNQKLQSEEHSKSGISGDIAQDDVASAKKSSIPGLRLNSAMDEEEEEEREDCLASEDMLSFSWQIAKGMEYLSEKAIVHRDLAARNVLVCDNKLVKVADFGLARRTQGEDVYRVTGQHNKLPVKWMSPEAINDGTFTTKSDVWSYGILLWEIATLGGFPYPGIRNRELLRLIKRGYRMERPDVCSEEFYQLMTCCWEEAPDKRPTFTKLRQDLEDWMQKQTPYLDVGQVDEDQPYYDAAAESPSSGSSLEAEEHT